MILKLAIRQIISHKKRSIITLLLSAIATFALVATTAFSDGTHTQMIRSAVEVYPGYMQVANKKYIDNPSFDNLIFDTKLLKDIIAKDKNIEAYSPRFETFALYSTADKSIGGLFCAIEPTSEAKVSRLKESLIAGEYLKDNDKNALYIGIELAKRLNLKVGDKLSFTTTNIKHLPITDTLWVKGFFKTNLFSFDNSAAFVNKKYFDTLMLSDNTSTKIILKPKKMDNIKQTSKNLASYIPKIYSVTNYKEYLKDLIKAMEIDEIFGYFTIGVLFIVIFFVISIFAFLSIYARVKEIGMLRAIGTTPAQIMKLLLYEAIFLGGISVSIGGAGGAYLAYEFNKNPISINALAKDKESQKILKDSYKQYDLVMDTTIPTAFDISKIIRDIVIMFILNILTVFYPIIMINRYTPIEAIRYV